MIAEATLSNWGKSTAIRLPSAMVKHSNLRVGQRVKLHAHDDGSISLMPLPPRPALDDLLAGWTEAMQPDAADVDWGAGRGQEAW